MDKAELNNCLEEILKDENGNTIEPSCGVEKLLCLLCENVSGETESITTDEIDEIMSK